jgi:quercetin dioxygenase-like cupin family protein
MKSTVLAGLASSLAGITSAAPHVHTRATNSTGLYVTEAPQYLRPYVLPKNMGQTARVGNQIYRFSVTGNSSDGAFLLMQTNAPNSNSLGVLPHIHESHYENFYCTKGRFQLWAQTNGSTEAVQQTRVLAQGDYGSVPHGTTHTFQVLDPDTQMTGVIQPGGFEQLFIDIADGTYPSDIGSPFIPANLSIAAASSDAFISALTAYDVYAELTFAERADAVDGFAGTGNWRNGSNELGADSTTPNFIAKNYGPKYLNSEGGVYKIIAPLAQETQSAGNFSMGTISMSPLLSNMTAETVSFDVHTAFQMEEGQLVVEIGGETASLIQGDVVFVPAGTEFTYYAAVSFTKFLYVTSGSTGIDTQLLQNSVEWEYASYPEYVA